MVTEVDEGVEYQQGLGFGGNGVQYVVEDRQWVRIAGGVKDGQAFGRPEPDHRVRVSETCRDLDGDRSCGKADERSCLAGPVTMPGIL